ncbi:MAG TPA: helix-turn-helix transcriptional regulator [Burkholderiaceae bacterium]|nr:helix-turn-helix transcriptional regulator [Burkholderiaceae bacterium]
MAGTKAVTLTELSELVSLIHEAYTDQSAWLRFVQNAARALSANSAFVTSISPVRQTGLWIPYRVDDPAMRQYEQYYRNVSPIRAGLRYAAPGCFDLVRGSDIIADAAMQKTEYYNDFLRPQDWRWVSGITVAPDAPQPLHYYVGFLRGTRSADFEPELDPVFRALGQHMAHVERLFRTRTLVRESAFAAGASAAYFLTGEGRLIEYNAAGDDLIQRRIVRVGPRGLLLGTQATDLWLQGALATALVRGGAEDRGLRLRAVDAELGELLYELRVLNEPPPVPSLRGARFLLVVGPPTVPDRAQAAVFAQRLFSWTRAEYDVASRLSSGQPLTEIAKARDSTLATVRSHLKRAKHKAGIRRQVELVRLVMKLENGELTQPPAPQHDRNAVATT